MRHTLEELIPEFLVPSTLPGAITYAILFLVLAVAAASSVRAVAKRSAPHLSDTTALHFVVQLAQLSVFVLALIVYAHLIPFLRGAATAMLAGASVISLIVGIAAQNTLGNLVAGCSLLLYRPFRVGEVIKVTSPQQGTVSGTAEALTLGYTRLRGTDGAEIIVPNSVMAGAIVVKASKA